MALSQPLIRNNQTLADYLLRLEHNSFNDYFLILCGGYQYTWGNENKVIGCWRVALYTLSITYVASIIFLITSNYTYWYLYISFWAQALILIPVIMITRKRMLEPVTAIHIECISDTIIICKWYMALALGLVSLYFTVIVYAVCTMKFSTVYIIAGIIGGLTVYAITLLNFWAIFFIVLDAKSNQLEIKDMISLAREQALTLIKYNEVYSKCKRNDSYSSNIADGVSIVAYISIVLFVLSIILLNSYANADVTNGTEWGILLCSACLQSREALLIVIALPYISEVNELHDTLRGILASEEWSFTPSNITPSSNTTSTSTTITIPLNNYNVTPTDILINQRNNLCLRLWAATIEKPLYMYVLGRVVKRMEMKAQLTTVCVIALGSVMSFLISSLYNHL